MGKSSLEVVVWLEQLMHGTWHRITRALFLMAARDSNNKQAGIVNPLEPADDREREILSGGETRKKRRMLLHQMHVSKVIFKDYDHHQTHITNYNSIVLILFIYLF